MTPTRRQVGPDPSAIGPVEHRLEHRRGESAGERVLLARVEASRGRRTARRGLGAVAEPRPGPRDRRGQGAASARRTPSQANAPSARMTRTSGRSASSRPRYGRQVSRSSGVGALAGGAQRTAALIRTPVRRGRRRAGARSAELASPAAIQRGEEEVARPVAGEDPPGPVAAVGGRREPDDQDPRRGIAEARDRVDPSTSRRAKRATSRAADPLAPGDEPRTAPAGGDLRVERGERVRTCRAHARGLLQQELVEPPRRRRPAR